LGRAALQEETDPLVRLTIALAQAVHCWTTGELRDSARAAAAGLATAEATGVHVLDDELRLNAGCPALLLGDFKEAQRYLDPLGEEPRTPFRTASHFFALGLRHLMEGDAPQAARHLQAAIRGAVELGFATGELSGGLFLARALFALDRREEEA